MKCHLVQSLKIEQEMPRMLNEGLVGTLSPLNSSIDSNVTPNSFYIPQSAGTIPWSPSNILQSPISKGLSALAAINVTPDNSERGRSLGTPTLLTPRSLTPLLESEEFARWVVDRLYGHVTLNSNALQSPVSPMKKRTAEENAAESPTANSDNDE